MVKFLLILYFFIFFIFENLESNSSMIEIQADVFTHDKENKRIYASGNVAIIDDEFKIFANNVFFNTEKKIISAREKVRIFYKDGSILRTEDAVADSKLENGKFGKSYFYIPDNETDFISTKNEDRFLRLAANSVERRTPAWEMFREAIFTACDICKNKKTNKYEEPIIQIKAKKVIHDKEKFVMKYYDSFLEFHGTPVFYFPYFSHTSPLVKRKRGFLAPKYFANSYLGSSIDIPYYIPVNDYEDYTLVPKFNTDKNPTIFLEHRKNMKNSKIESEVSGTISDLNVNQKKKEKIRGHIKTSGTFNINKNLFADFQLHRVTDSNYLQAFRYGYEDTLKSNLRLMNFNQNNFLGIEFHSFQELRKNINKKATPRISPRIISRIGSDITFNSFNWETNIEYLTLTRDKGNDLSKIYVLQNFEKPFLFNDGSRLKFGGHLSAGFYKVDNYDDPIMGFQKTSFFRGKFYPQITVNYSKPMYKINKRSKQIIEPKFLIVGGSNDGNDLHLPNEDSRSYDLDFIDLFERNRLSGNDRLDNGTRIDYGLNYVNQNLKYGFITNISLGHSYRIKKDVYQPKNSGFNRKLSNLLGVVKIRPTDNLNFRSRISIDSKDFSFTQAITDISLGERKNRVFLSHLLSKSQEGIEATTLSKRNQINVGFENRLSKYWSFEGRSNFNLTNEIKFLNWDAKIKYQDECFGLSFSWNRQYTYNSESPTSNNFLFLFSLNKIMENDL